MVQSMDKNDQLPIMAAQKQAPHAKHAKRTYTSVSLGEAPGAERRLRFLPFLLERLLSRLYCKPVFEK